MCAFELREKGMNFFMYNFRTDLALERRDIFRKNIKDHFITDVVNIIGKDIVILL